MLKSLYICDGYNGKPCGAVLVDEHDGFVITGELKSTLTGTAQKTLLAAPLAVESNIGMPELALCRPCFCEALGLPLETVKR